MLVTPVEQLIEKLRALQLKTARTIELLEPARSEENRRRQTEANRTPIAVPTPVVSNSYRISNRVIIANATRGNHNQSATVTRLTTRRCNE
jgi:hypothetical protein